MSFVRPSPEEKDFVRQHIADDVAGLALKLGRFPALNAQRVLRQVKGYQALARKVPSWASNPDLCFVDSLPLEQCSSEATAQYKADLVNRLENVSSLTDLTGGLGVDFAFLAAGRKRALYLERREDLCEAALLNFRALGIIHAEVKQADGPAFVVEQQLPFDLIYFDPARRSADGSKVIALSDIEPDPTVVRKELLKLSPRLLVKLSPMLDITLACRQLPETTEVHVVAVDGECKELLFLLERSGERSQESDAEAAGARSADSGIPSSDSGTRTADSVFVHPDSGNPQITAVNLKHGSTPQPFSFRPDEEAQAVCRYTDEPLTWLYEPHSALLKAGAFSLPTLRYSVEKLHPSSHLYTSAEKVEHFPGRSFVVDEVIPYHGKALKTALASLKKANITVRNFPESVAEIRKKTGLRDGGDVYLFATTLADNRKVLIKCRKG